MSLVDRAVLALTAFGTLNRAQVRQILPLWSNYRALTQGEVREVLLKFPA